MARSALRSCAALLWVAALLLSIPDAVAQVVVPELPAPAAPPLAGPEPPAPAASSRPEPFAFGDFTWVNGNNRQPAALLETKYITFSALLDSNYTYSFASPIDHTIAGTTTNSRHNELNLLMASVGGDFHYKDVRATLSVQFGNRAELVYANDPTSHRGPSSLSNILKYIREATVGYHFNVRYGLNLDVGIMTSFIGMLSYLNFENWTYQPSYLWEMTPYYFVGLRAQLFPTERTKIELWLVNGWQSYSKFNETPGVGLLLQWRPREWVVLSSHYYLGFDTRNNPGRLRFHTDNNAQLRYFNSRDGRVLSRGALSLAADFGCEEGVGVSCGNQYLAGFALYNQLLFYRNLFALTQGGGFVSNPGRYLVLVPPGPVPFDTSPGSTYKAWEALLTFDYLPSDYLTYRIEYVHRGTDVPYFAGPGGSTSPDGYSDTIVPPGYAPDRVLNEDRVTVAFLLRI